MVEHVGRAQTLAAAAVVAVALAGLGRAATPEDAPELVRGTCPATPVRDGKVRAGPFTGGVAAAYDVVDGGFSLRVGGMRTTTLSSKIPWFVSTRVRVDYAMRIEGRRLVPPGRTFVQTALRAGGLGGRGGVFPTIIDPPTVGCWKLTLRSGNVSSSIVMVARPRVGSD